MRLILSHSEESHPGQSTAPLALNELASLITMVDDRDLRARFLVWARKHIEAVHVDVTAPIAEGCPPPQLEPWDKEVFMGNVLRVMRDRIQIIEKIDDDGRYVHHQLGFVILKD